MGNYVKMLGQANPDDTNNALLYTKVQNATVWLDKLFICNVTAGAIAARVFIDDDGTTGDLTTAILYDKSVPANDTYTLDFDGQCYLATTSGSIMVRSATGDALTFTLFGEEFYL